MHVVGYVTMINTDEGLVTYGLFDTKEEAHGWAKNLDGAVSITPIYYPSWNRG
jgi:hypothetical protein